MVEIIPDDLYELEGMTPERKEDGKAALKIAAERLNKLQDSDVVLKATNAGEMLIRFAFPNERDSARIISAVQNMQIRRIQELKIKLG